MSGLANGAILRGCYLSLLSLLFVSAAYADGMPEGPTSIGTSTPPALIKQKTDTPPIIDVTKGANTNPLPDFELAKYQYCGDDRDCVVAINGCCDCVNGGIEVAVNKGRVSAFSARFDCLHVTCGLEAADPVCGSGVVTCVSHRCHYIDARNKEGF